MEKNPFPLCKLRLVVYALCCLSITAGCATTSKLEKARSNFYLEHPERSAANLAKTPHEDTDKVLFFMERGMINQYISNYKESTVDWEKASDLLGELDYYSLGRGTASFLVNDRLIPFRGAPYEQTLLHSFSAKSFFALGQWNEAAVEARNIIALFEDEYVNKFPLDPYSRYVAGFCMEMMNDHEAASYEYKAASDMLSNDFKIDPLTGRITETNNPTEKKNDDKPSSELVCFISIGRAPSGHAIASRTNYRWGSAPYAEIYCNGKYAGRSYTFANTEKLMRATLQKKALMLAAKNTTRIIIKDAVADAISNKDELLGEIMRFILFSYEAQDTRRWETLPLFLQIARVPCPNNLQSYEIILKRQDGVIISRRTVRKPISHHGSTAVSFWREL